MNRTFLDSANWMNWGLASGAMTPGITSSPVARRRISARRRARSMSFLVGTEGCLEDRVAPVVSSNDNVCFGQFFVFVESNLSSFHRCHHGVVELLPGLAHPGKGYHRVADSHSCGLGQRTLNYGLFVQSPFYVAEANVYFPEYFPSRFHPVFYRLHPVFK